MSFSASQSVSGVPCGRVLKVIPSCPFITIWIIQIARVVLGAALDERLGHVFRDQIKQAVAVDVVFPERRGVGDVGFNVLNRLRSASGSQGCRWWMLPIIM